MTYPEKIKTKFLEYYKTYGFEYAVNSSFWLDGRMYSMNRMTLSRWIKKEKEQLKNEKLIDILQNECIQFAIRTYFSAYKNKKHRLKKEMRKYYGRS